MLAEWRLRRRIRKGARRADDRLLRSILHSRTAQLLRFRTLNAPQAIIDRQLAMVEETERVARERGIA